MNVESVYPLSPMQHAMLLRTFQAPGTGEYVEQASWTIRGAYDADAFARAWQLVVDRHPVLRTAVFSEGLDEPVQVVRDRAALPVERHDRRGEPEDRFRELLEDERRRGLDLAAAPLLRLAEVRVADDEWRFALTYHHVVLDGWSLTLCLREVFAAYEALCRGAAPSLGAVQPYERYVAWLRGRDGGEAAAFWRAELAGLDSPAEARLPRATGDGPEGDGYATRTLVLPAAETARLREAARRCQVTLNALLQGTWGLLLSRYGAGEDVAFGSVVSVRPDDLPGTDAVLGVCIAELPVRVRVEPREPAAAWLRTIHGAQLRARAAGPPPPGRPPYDTLLVFQNLPDTDFGGGRAAGQEVRDFRRVPAAGGMGRALVLEATPRAELALALTHDLRRCDADGAARVLEHLRTLLEGIADDPEHAIGELSPLSAAERARLAEWNRTEADYPRRLCAHDLVAAQAARTPDAMAVEADDGTLTYAALERRSARLAARLRGLGVGPETRVAVAVERSAGMVVAVLGVLRAGGAYVPVDPAHPAERIAHVLADAGAAVVVADAATADALPAHGARVVRLEEADDAEPADFDPGVGPESAAYVVYTSGSTGKPKGVVVPHRALVNFLHSMRARPGLSSADVLLAVTTLSFDIAALELLLPLAVGARVVVASRAAASDAGLLAARLASSGATVMQATPSTWRMLLDDGWTGRPGLRALCGGEALDAELARRLRPAVAALWNLYGPTETTVWSTVHEVVEAEGAPPVGRPVANTRLHVLDAALGPVPVGVEGELFVGGDGVARGYLGRPELTAERFLPDPSGGESGARLYRTGDRARFRADGGLEYLGRADQQVKVRGFRVEPGEVEAVLAGHPAVRRAAVAARPDPAGGTRLVACMVPAGEVPPDAEELRAWLRGRLPEPMVPSAVLVLDGFPLTPNGKLDRGALAELADGARLPAGSGYVAPRGALEEVLAEAWAAVLGVERVGARDDFVALGGHSLAAARVIARVRRLCGVEVPFREFFEAPTVAGLAERVDLLRREGGAAAPPLVPVPREGPLPLSFAQQRLWFLHQLDPRSAAYNLPAALLFPGEPDVRSLERALAEVVRRHEALRTVFRVEAGEPVQVVGAPRLVPVPVVELSGLPADRREVAAREEAAAEAARPFDLARGPLLRALLLRLAADRVVLLVTLHHVVGDEWSMQLLVREASALYDAFSRGEAAPLPELPVQYADYAAWQRDRLRGDALRGLVDWWRARLEGAPALLELPTDRPRPAVQGEAAATLRFALPAELSAAARALGRREGATPFMVLLAAWKLLLSRYAGSEDVVVGSPVAGRTREELEGLIGFFVNTLVLRTGLSDDPPVRGLLARVRDGVLDAQTHQDLPFERLVEALDVERSPGHPPIFQVMFALQNTPFEGGAPRLGGLEAEVLETGTGSAPFDLSLLAREEEGAFSGVLEYRTELWDRATMERALGHFRALLEGMTADPARRLSGLPLLTAPERAQLLEEWNATERPFPRERCLHELFTAQAARTPDAPAVVFDGGALSYAELDARTDRLAGELLRRGVGPEARVAICVERGPELAVAVLGALKAGGAYVPLDPRAPAERLAYMLEDSGARVMVTREGLVGRIAREGVEVVLLGPDGAPPASPAPRANEFAATTAQSPPSRTDGNDETIPSFSPPPHAGEGSGVGGAEVTPENLCYVIYTSGSTGRPKGVAVPHSAVVAFATDTVERLGLGAGDRVLQFASPGFDVVVEELFPAWASGGAVVFSGAELLAPATLLREVERHGVTWFELPTAYWHEWVHQLARGGHRLPACVRFVIVGGERTVAPERLREWAALEVPLVHAFGLTETTVTSALLALEAGDDGSRWPALPIGAPTGNATVYVVGAGMMPVPVGVPGEMLIGGEGVARGYLDRPELTAERFVPDPFGRRPGARLYRTGDRVRWLADGNLEFLGRVDHQLRVRGFRVEPGEVEAALLEHPGVREAVVVAREDAPGERRLVAYVVADGEAAPAALRAHLRERLPEHMVPSAFVALHALPLSLHGKTDRRALPAPSEAPRTEPRDTARLTRTERVLAEVWKEVLGVDHVAPDDGFFDLGGHSLLLVRVHALLQERLGREVPIVELFQHPTLGGLAAHLDPPAERPAAPRPARRAPRAEGEHGIGIAVVGMSGRFPGARDLDRFWSNLREGVDSVARFTDDQLRAAGVPRALLRDPDYVRARGVLEGVEEFDPGFFGFSPREASLLDPQQRIFLECSWEALEGAGYDPAAYGGRVGVFVGADLNRYWLDLRSHRGLREAAGPLQLTLGNNTHFIATRASYKLGLSGPSFAVQTACSSSLVAVHLACQSLLSGESEMALAGGVAVFLPQATGYLYREGGVFAPDGRCRAFDAGARGTVGGNGAGVVLLKRLEDALADGDTVRAVIRASAVNNDGAAKVGFPAPSRDAQARVIGDALALAGVEPDTVTYVEAHGSGTELGDPIEVAALTQAFRQGTERSGFCALGSVKTNVGHLDTAAGVAGLIKTVLALEHGEIPPTLHFREPNPRIDFAGSPFFVADSLRPWERGSTPRRAGVSSFGLGGTNAHVVLEEAPEPAPSAPARGPHLLVLSARTPSALESATDRLAEHLRAHPEQPLADVAHTLRVGRRAWERRRVLVCEGREDAAEALASRDPRRLLDGTAGRAGRPVAFLFPGVGDQYPGMARGLYEAEPAFRAEVDRCAALLLPRLGADVRDALFPAGGGDEPAGAVGATDLRRMLGRGTSDGPLDRTALAHPALFVVEYALARLWESWGVVPEAVIGHSLGEYVAATLAGVFGLEDALALVAERARLIEELAPGAMLAVPLAEDEVRPLLGGGVALAAVNAPALCVVSGAPEAVARLEAELTGRGVSCRRLAASHAFHSPAMEPVAERLAGLVRGMELRAPRVPLVSNVTGTWITAEEATDPEYWARHLCRTVRFADGLGALLADPERVLLEVGPGRSLGTFALHSGAPEASVLASLRHAYTLQSDAAFLLGMLGRLWTMGARVEWSGLAAGEPRRRVPLPTYPFERQRCWVDRRKPDGTSRRRGRVRAEVYVPTWKRTPSPAPRPGDDARWLVFTDGSGGSALARRLEESGREVLTVEAGDAFVRRGARAYSLRPGSLDDCRALLRAAGVPGRVVFLAGAQDAPALDALARALAERGAEATARLDVVTRDAREVTGDEEGGGAAVLAALDAVRRDFPGIDCRSLDVPPAGPGSADEARRTEQLLAELTGGAEDPVVAWRGSRRWVRSFEPVRGSAAAVREGGVYLLLGADGPLARAVAERVAATPGARLLREADGSSVDGVVFTPDGPSVEAPGGIEAGFRWVESGRAEGWTSVDWRVGEVSGAVAARLLDAIAAAGDEREVVVSDGDPDAAPRPDVPALLAAPEPDPTFLYARPHLPNAYVAPSTDTERFVAGVWGDLLGVERVGVHDDFFSLGGHSLLAAQLLSRLRDGAGAELALRDVFESPTVAALAERVDAVRGAGGGHAPVVIRRVPRTGPLPLSPGQQRLWTLQQLEPDSPFYTVSESRHLKGRLDVGTLERALREVLRRHEALRSAYVEVDGAPVQVPHDVPAAYLRVEDLGALPPDAREALARRRAQEEARRPVDLAAPPVLRTRLLRLGEEEHVLLTAVHHIAYDGWSAGVFWRELRVLYDVFAQGEPSPFPEPELHYADFAAWHREWMETDAPAEDLAYWKEHLRGAPFVLDLPTDRPRPPVQGHRGALKTFTLDPVLSAGLAELCRREGTTLHIVLLAAFEVLLLRYTGQEDMVVGSLAANRSHPGTQDLVGYFLNTVALRARLDGDPSFRALLGRVREVSLGADAHQYLPFDALLEDLHVERDPSRNPLFQTMFILQQRAMHGWTPELPLLTFEHFEVDPGTAKFDLGLLLDELDGFLLALMEYDTDLFDRATAERMAEHYQALLRGAVEDPGRRLSDLPLLAPGERAQLLEGWNDTALEAPPARCVHDLFREQAARTPDAVAVVSEGGSLTYAELDHASDALAARLRERGVGPEARVGICLEPGPETLAAVLGVLGAGGAYVPLDPKHPADRLQYVLEDSGARVVVTEEGLEGRFEGLGREVVVMNGVPSGLEDTPHPQPLPHKGGGEHDGAGARPEEALTPRPPLPMLGEGGTQSSAPGRANEFAATTAQSPPARTDDNDETALPQNWGRVASPSEPGGGALTGASPVPPERNAVLPSPLVGEGSGVGGARRAPEPRCAQVSPDNLAYVIYTSGSTGRPKGVEVAHRSVASLFAAVQAGFGLGPGDVVPSLASFAFDIWGFESLLPLLCGATVRTVAAGRVTDVPALVAELEDATVLHAVPALMREAVREARGGGGRALPALRRAFVGGDAVPPELVAEMREAFPRAELRVLYGPTEATVLASAHRVPAGGVEGRPIGRPLGNVRLYVCDPVGGAVPVGVHGELWIGGAGVARGYAGRPELTAERFVPDPFSGVPGARLYRSGDRVRRLPDGVLEFLGRTDSQVKVRGFRIEPGEVEAVLAEHPGVGEAVVVARDDAPGGTRLVAYVTPGAAAAAGEEELRAHALGRLPDYMVPSAWVFLDALPRGATGKTDRKALPAPEASGAGDGYVAPRTAVEVVLTRAWSEVLRAGRVGVHDDFFRLGGDSILAIQVVSRVRRAKVHLSPRQLFEHRTVAALARVATTTLPTEAEQGVLTGEVEPTAVQRWFLEHPVPARHHWNVPLLLRPRERLDPALLARTVRHLLLHHDALRLRFSHADGRWTVRYAAPDNRVPFTRVDLSRLDAPERALAAALADAEASLELERGPLLRAVLFDTGADRSQRLLVTAHHLVIDGVSWRVLLEDLQTVYGELARGGEPRLPSKTTSLRHWTRRLAGYAASDALRAELAHWLAVGEGAPARLPLDHAGEAPSVATVRTVEGALDAEETDALLREVPPVYGTEIRDVLLAALVRAFAPWTGRPRLLVEIDGHGREEQLFEGTDLSRTVGWLTSLYPVLLDVGGAHGEDTALKRVKEQLRAVPHRGIGYGVLRHLSPDPGVRAALAALPQPEVRFEYLGQLDGSFPADSLLDAAPEPAGPAADPANVRVHLLDVHAMVQDGRLRVDWTYSPELHREETISRLAERYLAELRGLIDHCRSDAAGGATPSDFPLAEIDEDALAALEGFLLDDG